MMTMMMMMLMLMVPRMRSTFSHVGAKYARYNEWHTELHEMILRWEMVSDPLHQT